MAASMSWQSAGGPDGRSRDGAAPVDWLFSGIGHALCVIEALVRLTACVVPSAEESGGLRRRS